MLNIKNFSKIEGSEFQLTSGDKYLIGIAKDEGLHYTFAVFPLAVNGIAIIHEAIIYKLHRALLNRRGYCLTSTKLKQDVYVKLSNLTIKNFVLELHIQTGMIINRR